MALNKENLCWVLSDGHKGHEIQSLTLAECLAKEIKSFSFKLKQPWKTFSPRTIFGFQYGYDFKGLKPDLSDPPNIIITTGRKAAAVGKFTAQLLRNQGQQLKHIQILNPKDKTSHYDILLVPEHDQMSGSNIVTFPGSLHPYSPQWFESAQAHTGKKIPDIAIIVGNPVANYFKKCFKNDLQKIRKIYPNRPVLICGSPRLPKEVISDLKSALNPSDKYWFSTHDGNNPYQQILLHTKHIFVTADSINMMNECAATDKAVTILAQNKFQNSKHQLFIDSLKHRWQKFESNDDQAFEPISYALSAVIRNNKFQRLLNQMK